MKGVPQMGASMKGVPQMRGASMKWGATDGNADEGAAGDRRRVAHEGGVTYERRADEGGATDGGVGVWDADEGSVDEGADDAAERQSVAHEGGVAHGRGADEWGAADEGSVDERGTADDEDVAHGVGIVYERSVDEWGTADDRSADVVGPDEMRHDA